MPIPCRGLHVLKRKKPVGVSEDFEKCSFPIFLVVHDYCIPPVVGYNIQMFVIPGGSSDRLSAKEIVVNLIERHCLRNKVV